MSGIYVTASGDWGDSGGMRVYDTTDWSPLDFDIVDSCAPSERQRVAAGIEKYRKLAASIVAAHDSLGMGA